MLGTTVAREGIAFVSTVEVHGREIPLTFTIRRRSIPSRVKIVKAERMQAPKRVVHRYFCSFTAIAADDWDAVVRYVENMPEPRAVPLPVLVDDECRSLTSAVQERIVDHLVRLKRLAKPAAGVAPLIRLQAGAIQELEDGRTARDVRIHSRILAEDRFRSYRHALPRVLRRAGRPRPELRRPWAAQLRLMRPWAAQVRLMAP